MILNQGGTVLLSYLLFTKKLIYKNYIRDQRNQTKHRMFQFSSEFKIWVNMDYNLILFKSSLFLLFQ